MPVSSVELPLVPYIKDNSMRSNHTGLKFDDFYFFPAPQLNKIEEHYNVAR